MNDSEFHQMLLKNLIAHQDTDDCKCPFECPSCETLIHWDMGTEGHYCTNCGYYDGPK